MLALIQHAAGKAEWRGTRDTLVVGWAPPELLEVLRNCAPADVALWAPWALHGERSRVPGFPPPELRTPTLPPGVVRVERASKLDELRPALVWVYDSRCHPQVVRKAAKAVIVGTVDAVQYMLDHGGGGCFPIAQEPGGCVAVKLA